MIPKSTLALEHFRGQAPDGMWNSCPYSFDKNWAPGPREPETQVLPVTQHLTSALPLGRRLEEGTLLPQHLGAYVKIAPASRT